MDNLEIVNEAIKNSVVKLFGDEFSTKSLVVEETKKVFMVI